MTEALGYRPGLDQPELDWKGAVPVATRFDDPYYSLENGLAEADYVFLDGNGLPERLSDGFHIAELGFGTGLNMLATARAWQGPGRIRFTSFEAHPLETTQIARALAAFPELDPAPFLAAWSKGARQIALDGLDLEVIEGPAAETLPQWHGAADAWYLDGFAPAKNPALWTPELMAQVLQFFTIIIK